MKNAPYYIITIALSFMFFACATTPNPEIIMNPGPDNPVVMKMKHDICTGNPAPPSYSWLWWYAPVAGIATMWAVKYLFFRKCVEEDMDVITGETKEEPKKEVSNEPKPE
jgi:hypothetical protein